MNVRFLDPSEWQLLKALRLRALADSPDAFGRTLDEESRFDDPVWMDRLRGQSSLVAEIDRAAVGIASARVDQTNWRRGLIFAMWVDPAARRKGAGRALLEFALAALKERGVAHVELTVTEGNEAAFALYESAGFTDTGHREPLREGSVLQVLWLRARL